MYPPNGVIGGTLQHKMCLDFNYILLACRCKCPIKITNGIRHVCLRDFHRKMELEVFELGNNERGKPMPSYI